MTIKHLRVLLAAGMMLLLCGGCLGNCLTDFSDAAGRALGGGSGDHGYYYDYVIEGDGGPIGAFGDAGPNDAFGDAGVE